jgi:hypothetical protein
MVLAGVLGNGRLHSSSMRRRMSGIAVPTEAFLTRMFYGIGPCVADRSIAAIVNVYDIRASTPRRI